MYSPRQSVIQDFSENILSIKKNISEIVKKSTVNQSRSNGVHLHNIPLGTTKDEIRPVFELFGQVMAINIPNDSVTGLQRNYATVFYSNEQEATYAVMMLTLHSLKIKRSVIRVELSRKSYYKV